MERKRNRLGKYVEDVISIKWLAVGVIIYFYGDYLKRRFVQGTYTEDIMINGWDIYLILFFIFPLILSFSANTIIADFDIQTLIRLGSFKRWVYRSLKLFWKRCAPLLFLWAFISLFLMIGIPYSWSWSHFSKLNSPSKELLEFFGTPISTFVFQFVSLLIILSLIHIVLAIFYVITKNKNFVLVACVFLFLGGIVGFKLLPKEFAYLYPSTYLSFDAIDSINTLIFRSVIVIAFAGICPLILNILDINNKKPMYIVRKYSPFVIYLILCALGIISTAVSLK